MFKLGDLRLRIRPVRASDFQTISLDKSTLLVTRDNLLFLVEIQKNPSLGNSLSTSSAHAGVQFTKLNGSAAEPQILKGHLDYSSEGSLIVDMQGINTLLFARSIVFEDSTIRGILVATGLLNASETYLRFGAAGARPNDGHPGGEVVEYCLISGSDGSGFSQSCSGYLKEGAEFGTRIPLHENNLRDMREERTVYSHTAWLPDRRGSNQSSIFHVDATEETASLLSAIRAFTSAHDMNAYSMQIVVDGSFKSAPYPLVTGRILRRIPTQPLADLKEAINIGLEQRFSLVDQQTMVGFGTYYARIEPEWTTFTNGRLYEPKGHTHALLSGHEQQKNQHNCFHLRDVFLNPCVKCCVILTPIERIVKIEPVMVEGSKIISRSSLRILRELPQ